MIKLNDKYVIKYDTMNVILCKVGVMSEKSKTPGQETVKVVGYFSSFESLIGALLSDNLLNDNLETLQDILNSIKDFKEDILHSIKELNPDTIPYKYHLETDEE